ncbi:hypothetical protein [Nocardioides sp. CER19]|uniref:hypothetical protein n=1 Tax=Nocardioides sp. CER19 TaxID=3038538 RepID=UPI00244D0CBE|nr:hypothetical protein [Nocardioides sp. CER19]MDH2414806.1 hypothetical protein [Nocardioides sp. CER19]
MATTRTMALGATGVLAVVAAAVIGATAGDHHGTTNADEGRPSASATSRPTAGGGGGATTPPATGTPGQAGSASTTSTAGSDAGTTGPTSELLPSASSAPTTTGYVLPHPSTTEPDPLLSPTLPKSGVARGRLVNGFPRALAPPKGTEVESSSVAVASNVLQAALVATGGDPQSILLHYRELLTERGYAEQPTQAVENSPAIAFAKGDDNVTVTTQEGKTYLLAILRPKDAED